MDKTLRTAATGLNAQQHYVEIISNNLANVNTTAFKKSRAEFQDLIYETLRPSSSVQANSAKATQELQIGSGAELVGTTKQFGQGDLMETGNPMDMAINGEGFFVVRKNDNSLAYTRDGSFKIDKTGMLITSQGYSVDPPVQLPPDTRQVKITRDGYVTVITSASNEEQQLGQMQLAKFLNPAGLSSQGENFYGVTPASGEPTLEQPGTNNVGSIMQSHLEASNVDLVTEMVNMIIAQRAYEINSKSVKTADDILGIATSLKR